MGEFAHAVWINWRRPLGAFGGLTSSFGSLTLKLPVQE